MKLDELIKRLQKLQSDGAKDCDGNDIDFYSRKDELDEDDYGRRCYVAFSYILRGGDADYLMEEGSNEN